MTDDDTRPAMDDWQEVARKRGKYGCDGCYLIGKMLDAEKRERAVAEDKLHETEMAHDAEKARADAAERDYARVVDKRHNEGEECRERIAELEESIRDGDEARHRLINERDRLHQRIAELERVLRDD